MNAEPIEEGTEGTANRSSITLSRSAYGVTTFRVLVCMGATDDELDTLLGQARRVELALVQSPDPVTKGRRLFSRPEGGRS